MALSLFAVIYFTMYTYTGVHGMPAAGPAERKNVIFPDKWTIAARRRSTFKCDCLFRARLPANNNLRYFAVSTSARALLPRHPPNPRRGAGEDPRVIYQRNDNLRNPAIHRGGEWAIRDRCRFGRINRVSSPAIA